MKVFYSDLQPFVLPPGHIYPADKYIRLRQELVNQKVVLQNDLIPAEAASARQILLVHNRDYYEEICSGSISARKMRVIGLPWSRQLIERAHLGIGAAILAADEALRNGIAGCLSGGTHHAFRGEGRGFCVFNDVAVTIADLFSRQVIQRAAVIDVDAHQGNGTAGIFRDNPNVLILDIYGDKNYPVRKVPADIDLPLPAGAGDAEYLETLSAALPQVLAFQPDIIFYIGGVDPLESDRFNTLKLTLQGLQARDALAAQFCRQNSLPLVLTMGGGYSAVKTTVQAHVNTYIAVSEVYDSLSAH
jgi:acetoin utilization deacetylase AcuC-like enzyme